MIETRVFRNRLQVKDGLQKLLIGDGKILNIAEDRSGLGRIDIWYEAKGDLLTQHTSTFVVVGTGQVVPEGFDHMGTVVMQSGLVWHIYRLFECEVC